MQSGNTLYSRRRLVIVTFLSWLSMLGFDFLLHAGLLAGLYFRPSPFLVPPLRAFQLIPVGYSSFLLLAILLVWLMQRQRVAGGRQGIIFGMKVGTLSWGAFVLGLLSISTADSDLLMAWFAGQTVELAIAGAVIGRGLAGEGLGRLTMAVIGFVFVCVIIAVTLQTLGWVPAIRL